MLPRKAVDREFLCIVFSVLRLSRFLLFLLAHTLTPSAFFFVPSSFFFLLSSLFFLPSSFFLLPWAILAPSWAPLGSILNHLGPILSNLGPILSHLGSILVPPWLPKISFWSPEAPFSPSEIHFSRIRTERDQFSGILNSLSWFLLILILLGSFFEPFFPHPHRARSIFATSAPSEIHLEKIANRTERDPFFCVFCDALIFCDALLRISSKTNKKNAHVLRCTLKRRL